MTFSKVLADAFQENTRYGGISTLPSLWISKRALKFLIRNSISSLRRLCNHSFYINLKHPQGITYNPCPEGFRRVVILKNIISGPFNYGEQNGYLKISIRCFRGNGERRREVISLQQPSTIKKGTNPSNFQSNGPFLKFLRQLLQHEVPWSKTKKK